MFLSLYLEKLSSIKLLFTSKITEIYYTSRKSSVTFNNNRTKTIIILRGRSKDKKRYQRTTAVKKHRKKRFIEYTSLR